MITATRTYVLLFYLLIGFSGLNAYGQDAFFKTHLLTGEIGNSSIQTIFQDRQGFIWLGTGAGLYRFDGINYTLLPADDSLLNKSCSVIYQDKDGVIWTGSRSGHIGRIIKGRLQLFEPEEGTPRAPVTDINQDANGNIWFSTYGEGIYCYTGNRLYNLNTDDGLSDNFAYTLAADNKGNMWAGTDGGISVCHILNGKKTIRLVSTANGLPDNIVMKLLGCDNKTMWAGMQDGGICTIDFETHSVTIPEAVSKWSYGQVNDLIVVGNRLWAGTEDQGVIAVDLNPPFLSRAYTNFSDVNYLKINKLLSDSEGNVWFASNNVLLQSPGEKLEILPVEKDKNYSNIHSILCDNTGNVWFSNDDGLFFINRKLSSNNRPQQILSLADYRGMKIISLYQDNLGFIWLGTFGDGLLRIHPATKAITRYSAADGLANGNILSITGFKNEVWFATLGGAFRCILPQAGAPGSKKIRFEGFGEASGLGNNFIYSVFADSKNRIWFATDGKGITVRENGKFINYAANPALKDKVVYSITEDKSGNIWFSTSGAGLYCFDGKSFRNYALKEGISNLSISGLTAAGSQNIFTAHSKGVDILDPLTGKFNYLGPEAGIHDINPDLNTLAVDELNNLIWIGTTRGIVKISAGEYMKLQQPVTRLKRVLLFLNETDTLGSHVFEHQQNHFTFDFIGLWYNAPEQVNYQVMLKGYDIDWINTRNTSVIYSSLAPGKYTFMVRSSVNRDFTDAVVASYSFEIRKPFWQTGWFITGLLLLAALVVYFFIKIRETRLKREESLQKEKIIFQFETLKSQVNPHFLFNSFSTLSAIIDEDKEQALDYVQKLSAFFRNILEYRDKTLISLKEELELAGTYFYLQKQRYNDNFKLTVDIANEYLSTFIPPMTLQMILENAIKHNVISADKPLTVTISVKDNYLVISNNIQPKKNQEASTGIGLQNIANRYRIINGSRIDVKITAETYTIFLPVIKREGT